MNLLPKKSLGQHFLNSKHVLEQIITAANIKNGENILEIGPGTGVLTGALLVAGARVIAVEKDDRAYLLLQDKFSIELETGRLRLIHGDILTLDRESLKLDEHQYAIVANIPYYITGSILQMFLEHQPRPNRMILLVQKEVAERIVARDGKESILSISVKAFGIPKIIAKVPRGAFTPAPTVDSAILEMSDISDRNFKEKNVEISHFFKIVKAGFAHKRKYLIRNLESLIEIEKLQDIFKNLGLDEKIRAEDVELEKWLGLCQ